MSSIGPYTQSYDFRHMYSFVDSRPHTIQTFTNPNSISGFILRNPKTTKFAEIVKKAGLIEQLNDPQLKVTMFIPTDEYLSKLNVNDIDIGLARQIIHLSTLNYVIGKNILAASPVSQYITKSYKQLYITNIRGKTQINQCAIITEFDIKLDNGLVHLTNNILTDDLQIFIN